MHPIRIPLRLLRIIQTNLAKVFELHRSSLETQTVEIRFPDCSDLERVGDNGTLMSSGFDVIITDRMGHNVIDAVHFYTGTCASQY